jgi:hypothetical protein
MFLDFVLGFCKCFSHAATALNSLYVSDSQEFNVVWYKVTTLAEESATSIFRMKE